MRRRRRRHKFKTNQTGGTFGLNINSMTDMFTLLLVFLLQFQSSSEIEINPDKAVKLPKSSSEANPIAGVQVHLTHQHMKVEDKAIAAMKDLDFDQAAVDPSDSNFLPPLFNELSRIIQAEKAKEEMANNGDTTVKPNQAILEGRLLLVADATYTYQTLRKVMYTASMAGFPKLKLATVAGK